MKTLNLKKFFACLMATLLFLTSFSISIATAETEGDFEYSIVTEFDENFNSIKSVKITGYTGNDSKVVIPDTIAELPVTVINSYAFQDNESITSVTIPETVVEIGSWVFEDCKNLAEINLPSSLETIGGGILTNTAYALDSKNWEGEFLYIGDYLLECTDRISGDLKIKDGTKIIAAFTFCYNENITSVTVPSSVTYIGIYAFADCNNLSSVSLNEGLEYIDSGAFENTAIDDITIPQSVKSIGSWTFANTKIESFNVNANIEYIDDSAFDGCTSLKNITVDSNNKYYYSIDGVLFEKSNFDFLGDTLIYYPSAKEGESYTIPDNTQYLGYSAFSNLVYLKELNVPASVTLFSLFGSANLEKINIAEENEDYKSVDGIVFSKDGNTLVCYPNGITAEKYEVLSGTKEAEYSSICNNPNIKEITFPEGFEKIAEFSISGCENLTTINLPSTLTELGDFFINDCPNLTSINFNGTTEDWNSFDVIASDIIFCPNGLYVNCNDGVIELAAPDGSAYPTESTAPEVTNPSETAPTGTTSPDPTESTATNPTESTATDPTETTTSDDNTGTTAPEDEFMLGDANMDGKLNIRDATAIQKHIAKVITLDETALKLADFTQDGKLNIKDATNIQKKIAGII